MSAILAFFGTILNIVGVICIIGGGIAWFLLSSVYTKHKKSAVATGLIIALIGGGILTISAFIHPPNIQIPEVNVPAISAPVIPAPNIRR